MPTVAIATKTTRTGTFEGVYHAPSGISGAVLIQTNADAVDIEDDAKGMTLEIFISDDGVIWPEKPSYACTYLGGIHYKSVLGELVRYAAAPGLIFNASKVAGKYVKGRVSLVGEWNIGLNAAR